MFVRGKLHAVEVEVDSKYKVCSCVLVWQRESGDQMLTKLAKCREQIGLDFVADFDSLFGQPRDGQYDTVLLTAHNRFLADSSL